MTSTPFRTSAVTFESGRLCLHLDTDRQGKFGGACRTAGGLTSNLRPSTRSATTWAWLADAAGHDSAAMLAACIIADNAGAVSRGWSAMCNLALSRASEACPGPRCVCGPSIPREDVRPGSTRMRSILA